MLNRKYTTAMLSNGNIELLDDLEEYGKLGFRERISAAEFGGCELPVSTPFRMLVPAFVLFVKGFVAPVRSKWA